MADSSIDGRLDHTHENVPQPPPISQHAGITFNSMTSRLRGLRSGKNGPKQSHKVKFSMGDGEGAHDGHQHTQTRGPLVNQIPEIPEPASEDVADHTLTPPDWEGRTHAAAAHALTRASRLANRLSTASTATKAGSGSNTLIYTPTKGKYTSPVSQPLAGTGLDGGC